MTMLRQGAMHISLVVLAAALLLPAAASAQTGTIAGSVKDTTGAVLPGVTVEAASPALIEKVRTAVTDGQGEYKIVDLRPGAYTVTFTLTGFSTVKREGIELTANITANVSAELRVGSLTETITVTGQSSLVDVQNTTQHRAVTRNVMDDLPTGRQFGNYAVLIPGIVTNQQDVGGSGMVQSTTNIVGIHGSNAREMPMIIDGMRYANVLGTGGGSSGPYLVNNGMVQEIAIDTSGQGADAEVSGVQANVILKQGGNTFTSSGFGSYSNDWWTMDNFDIGLVGRGVARPAVINRLWDVTLGAGGPIKQDKIWFYGSYRNYGIYVEPVGAHHAVDPLAIIFVPDTSRKAVNENPAENFALRVTWQTTKNSKLALYGDHQNRCICASGLSATRSFEATTRFTTPFEAFDGLFQAVWNWTVTNKLLVELGETAKPDAWGFAPRPELLADQFGVVDAGTGITSRAFASRSSQASLQFNGKAIVTYVTGSHNLKVGAQWFHGGRTTKTYRSADTTLGLRNGVPQQVTQSTTPLIASEDLDINLGLFVQEQYTLKRVTANLGVRYNHLKVSVREQHRAPVRYIGRRDFAAIKNVPNWHDITPRLGMSWDLFGTGKTALKWSLGKYVETHASGFAEPANPLRGTAGTTTNRPWSDTNGNLLPDCDLTNLAANGECGGIDNQNFGKAIVVGRFDPAAVTGWGTRGYNWEVATGVQHELRPGLSVEVGYFRRWFGNFRVFQNVAVQPTDFDPYCVTTPVDARLPDGGGKQLCGFYDIKPSSGLFGANDTLVTKASNIGDMSQVYNGVDITGTWRGPKGVLVQGGMNVGRLEVNYCDVVIGHPDVTALSSYLYAATANVNVGATGANQMPRATPFCDVAPPYIPQVKFLGVYPLPWYGLQTSATFQSIRYPQEESLQHPGILARRSYTTAEIQNGAGGLGRPLAGGTRAASLSIVPPGTLYEGRMYQLDWRLTKTFKVKRGRIQPQFDVYNLFNDNTVLTQNNTFGSAWRRPLTILQGRTFKFGVQADF